MHKKVTEYMIESIPFPFYAWKKYPLGKSKYCKAWITKTQDKEQDSESDIFTHKLLYETLCKRLVVACICNRVALVHNDVIIPFIKTTKFICTLSVSYIQDSPTSGKMKCLFSTSCC